MQHQTHQITVGNIRCVVLADGQAMFGIDSLMARFPQLEEFALRDALQNTGEDPDALSTFYNTLLIQTETRNILVDGGERSDRHASAGFTLMRLAEIGLTAADIDTVVITHAHGDHVIGLFDAESNQPVYTNAKYVIAQAEWEFWTDPEKQAAVAPLLNQLKDRLTFVDFDADIAPGVRPISLPGHTVGHTGLMIQSDGDCLLHAVDIVHAQMQFAHPDWTIRFDTDPVQAHQTRVNLFNRLADEQVQTLFFHMPFPALGYVRRAASGFSWHPIS